MDLGIGIIYQELNLAPHLSVAENIFLGREPRLLPGWVDGAKMRREAQALMENLGMGLDVRTLVGPAHHRPAADGRDRQGHQPQGARPGDG